MSYVAASEVETNRPLVSRHQRPSFSQQVGLRQGGEVEEREREQDIDLRQLRHHTKNTLQRVLGLIAEAPGLCDTPAGAKIAQELEHRISLSASISDALFGLTNAPGSIGDRLRQLAGAVVGLMRDPDQMLRVGVSVRGACPSRLREAVLRTANELLSNAVKHGMKGRSNGRITVRLVSDRDSTNLTVVDNGWGFSGSPRRGEGLSLAHSLAARYGGLLELDGMDGTVATLELPHTTRSDQVDPTKVGDDALFLERG
jgi:two-component sensor histidine kinase